jgi:hypothetical protein
MSTETDEERKTRKNQSCAGCGYGCIIGTFLVPALLVLLLWLQIPDADNAGGPGFWLIVAVAGGPVGSLVGLCVPTIIELLKTRK